MCTLSWTTVHEGGYELFFNRDELNTRGPEQPVRLETRNGVAFAAPRDCDRGGTWLLTNAHGVTVALLNDYAAQWRPSAGNRAGRGAVVMACAMAATAQAAVDLAGGLDLAKAEVGAFRLVVLAADGEARRLHWAGEMLVEERDERLAFATSSSFQTEAVCAERCRRFELLLAGRKVVADDELAAFHWTYEAANGAASVLMRRPGARTRSVTRVSVRRGHVEMGYQPVGETGEPATGAKVGIRLKRL